MEHEYKLIKGFRYAVAGFEGERVEADALLARPYLMTPCLRCSPTTMSMSKRIKKSGRSRAARKGSAGGGRDVGGTANTCVMAIIESLAS